MYTIVCRVMFALILLFRGVSVQVHCGILLFVGVEHSLFSPVPPKKHNFLEIGQQIYENGTVWEGRLGGVFGRDIVGGEECEGQCSNCQRC